MPVWKGRGDVAECGNYRPIRLLCHAVEILERVLDGRFRQIVAITPHRCGFVIGCGTTDAIHAARLLPERHQEKKPVRTAFLDLEEAFDRVPPELVWQAIRSRNVPEAYIRWVQPLHCNVTGVVRYPVGTSPPFDVEVCVHQGSALSPLPFVLRMNTMTADIDTPHPWSLLYADDVFPADEGRQQLPDRTQQWKTRIDEYEMRLDVEETEYLECGPQSDGSIGIDGKNLKVSQLK